MQLFRVKTNNKLKGDQAEVFGPCLASEELEKQKTVQHPCLRDGACLGWCLAPAAGVGSGKPACIWLLKLYCHGRKRDG